MSLGNNHLGNIFAEVITIKTLFASAKPLAIADCRGETRGLHSYWKKFHVKSHKKQKIFFCTPVSKFQEILTLNICDGAKQIYPKKQKRF